MADEEVGATGAARSGGNPLLVGAPPVEETVDRQIHALITTSDNIYFDQWKKNYYRGTPTRLRAALTQLLPTLVGARDYAGAAKVLAIMYHRFSVTPALCVEASLEVMRRQQDYRSDLLNFYESALKDRRLDKMLLLKEMLLFHIIHGEFYEAYRLYQDKIQNLEEAEKDARLLANFGMLCYWLLFIESKEMRDMLKQQELDGEDGDDDDDDDDDDMEDNDNGLERRFQSSENVESVIESTYLFKTPIGVHVLYQHASGALRRAVALCPHSAMYVEHYSQLLILVGSVQSACDYLESYFHAHPADPHGARMLSGFLERYYPDSVDAQVSVYIRWMKADPSCIYALEKVMELSSAGAISSYTLTKALVEALDLCGSDMHVIQNPQVAITLWRNLAELLTAMDDEEFATAQVDEASTEASYNHETIADIGAQRLWWKRLYFLRPSTVKEVVAASNSGTALMEVSIYRAAVANRLFPGRLAMAEVLQSAMRSQDASLNRDCLRLFKSFFPIPPSLSAPEMARKGFCNIPLIDVAVTDDDKKSSLPTFNGGSNAFRVIERRSIVKTVPGSDMAKVEVTRHGANEKVDPHLVEDLLNALEDEVESRSPSVGALQRKRKAAEISAASAQVTIPAYVAMVEEEAYSYPEATPRHIFTMVSEKLSLSDMVLPTFKQVQRLIRFFRLRWNGNLVDYGHRGVLLRYEAFLAKYVLQLRVKSIFEVTPDVVKAAILEMKRVLPSSHPHFPGESLVELLMCNKMSSFARQRRVRLAEIRRALRPILKLFMYVNENELAAGAWAVCKEGGLEGVISREDVMRTVQSLLPGHYFWVIEGIDYRSQHALANPVVRGTSNDPEKILRSMKRRHKYTKVTIPHIQAVMWMERYEAAHGRFVDDDSEFWERAKRAKRTKPNKQNDVDIIVLDADGEERRGTRRGRIAKRIKPNKQNDKDADATVIDEGIAEEKKSTDDTSEEEDDRGSDYGEESN